MYGWDPEGGFPNAVWSGTLMIDGPCVYLDVSHQDGTPVPEGEPLRSFVRLPAPLTRLDPATGKLWVGEHGPMSTGDEVVLVGSEGWRQSWNQPGEDTHVFEFVWADPADPSAGTIPICSAQVSLYAASMSPADSGEGQPIDTEASTHLAGLYPWDSDRAHTDELGLGILIVDAPCLYIQAPGGESRSFLRLPRPLVRFDSDSNSIWVGTHGPMTTGDEVMYQAGASTANDSGHLYEGGCSAQKDRQSMSLEPGDDPIGVGKASPPLSDGTIEEVEPESPPATSAVDDPKELVGMRAYTGWVDSNYAGLDGILFIEYPCVYLYPQDNNEALYSREESEITAFSASTTPPGERALLSLVRDWTDYDPETNALTFRRVDYVAETDSLEIGDEGSGEGPIASGDRVELSGIGDLVIGHEDVCQRDFDITVDYMSLCRLNACRMEREARRQADTTP